MFGDNGRHGVQRCMQAELKVLIHAQVSILRIRSPEMQNRMPLRNQIPVSASYAVTDRYVVLHAIQAGIIMIGSGWTFSVVGVY